MSESICYKKISLHNRSEKAAVLKLDVYIKKHEKKFGKIASQKILSRKQLKLLRLIQELMKVIEKEEINKQQGIILQFLQPLF